jgi:4-amino-4-deoxy-L-arabinose transferase-like glycosyltransferase
MGAALAARGLWGTDAGLRTAAMLASMPLFVLLSQLLTLDMSLTAYMTLALAAFLAAQSAPPRAELGWMVAAWAATALGVLTKGIVAAAIPAAVLALYSVIARDFSPWRRLHAAAGGALFLAIALPWYALAAHRDGDFLRFFFIHEHLQRYLTPSADREQPWWFFVPVFLLGSLPWTVPAVRALATGWRRATGGRFDPALFLRLWVLFVLVFFSLSDSKLIPYILPAWPALALLMAGLPQEAIARDLTRTALLTIGVAIGLGLLCLFAPSHIVPSERSAYFLALGQPIAQVAVLLAASGSYVLTQRRRGVTRSAIFLGVGWTLSGLLLVQAAAHLAPIYSGVELARALPTIPSDVTIYSIRTYDQTLPFYWRHTVTLVAYRGELDYGLKQDPAAEIPDIDQFIERWNASSNAFAIMDANTFALLTQRRLPMREIAHDANRVLAARR